jgi:hypothetical protein
MYIWHAVILVIAVGQGCSNRWQLVTVKIIIGNGAPNFFSLIQVVRFLLAKFQIAIRFRDYFRILFPRYGTYFMSPLWRPEFGRGFWTFRKFVGPFARVRIGEIMLYSYSESLGWWHEFFISHKFGKLLKVLLAHLVGLMCSRQAVTTGCDCTSVSHKPIFRLENYAALGTLKLHWDDVVYGGCKVELHALIIR